MMLVINPSQNVFEKRLSNPAHCPLLQRERLPIVWPAAVMSD
ncbi:hypothetical protein ACT8ZS_19415 [Paenibacillus sp. M.A.Huq-84]